MNLKKMAFLCCIICTVVSACGEQVSPSQKSLDKNVATLYLVDADGKETTCDLPYQDELTVPILVDGLTQVTGLHYELIGVTKTGVGANAGGPIRYVLAFDEARSWIFAKPEQEAFSAYKFSEYDSMAWFMLNSLYATVVNNLNCDGVYFTMIDGSPMELPNLTPPRRFAEPYQPTM